MRGLNTSVACIRVYYLVVQNLILTACKAIAMDYCDSYIGISTVGRACIDAIEYTILAVICTVHAGPELSSTYVCISKSTRICTAQSTFISIAPD